MANVKVSSSFNKFLAKNATAVAEAKTAENTMMTCKMPIGWKGHCVCVGGVADTGKDRKDDKGNVQAGNDFVNLDFNVVNDEEYAGSKFSRHWSFYDSEKATAMDRFTWMLNEMENLGLTREVREDPETSMETILGQFIDKDTIYAAEVVADSYARDGKKIKLNLMEAVDGSSSMSPTSTPPTSKLTVGGDVKYMGKEWELVDVDGDDLAIKSKTSGAIRNVKISEIE